MYGEDIELSNQVIKHGYKNYYLADTSIIHYKGESTKKGSLNYVKEFYKAMLIFARKNFSKQQVFFYSIAIYFAIFLKGFQTFVVGFIKKNIVPILDFMGTLGLTWLMAEIWALKIKFSTDYYPTIFYKIVIPLYAFIWIASAYLSGAYEKPFKSNKAWKGIIMGTLIIAAIYGFLPNDLRFSRAIIILGALASFIFYAYCSVFYTT
ncbi:MAG: hypothetical protein LRY27_02620 [Chitinophagales bacterium]|nr:hypothetical protein [Chitinophagales bacterium]